MWNLYLISIKNTAYSGYMVKGLYKRIWGSFILDNVISFYYFTVKDDWIALLYFRVNLVEL